MTKKELVEVLSKFNDDDDVLIVGSDMDDEFNELPIVLIEEFKEDDGKTFIAIIVDTEEFLFEEE